MAGHFDDHHSGYHNCCYCYHHISYCSGFHKWPSYLTSHHFILQAIIISYQPSSYLTGHHHILPANVLSYCWPSLYLTGHHCILLAIIVSYFAIIVSYFVIIVLHWRSSLHTACRLLSNLILYLPSQWLWQSIIIIKYIPNDDKQLKTPLTQAPTHSGTTSIYCSHD